MKSWQLEAGSKSKKSLLSPLTRLTCGGGHLFGEITKKREKVLSPSSEEENSLVLLLPLATAEGIWAAVE